MIKKHKALNAIVRGSAKMASATMLSRILGLVREQVMAGLFGASGMSDAFFVAYRIPNLLRGLFAEGAFSSAFVPTFIKAQHEYGHEGARSLLWRVFLTLGIMTALLSVLLAFYSHEIVSLFVDDLFKNDTAKFMLAVKLTQVMAPYLCLTSLAAVFMGALNSYQSYFTPAFAPAIFNITVIVCAFIFPYFIESEHNAYYAISYGIVVGGLFQLIFQFPKLLKLKLAPIATWQSWTSKYQKRIIIKMGPGVLGTAAQHMNLLISTILATGSTAGAVSWLTYAFRLFQFPVGVIGVSIGNTFLVEFSRCVKAQDKEGALRVFKSTQELALMILLPITLVGFFGAELLVKLVFERGKFDAAATYQTSIALKYYLLSLPLYGFYKNLNAGLYALERASLPVIFSSISIALSILISWLWIDDFGFQILALGNLVVFGLNIIFMAIAMRYFEGWGLRAYLSLKSVKAISCAILVILGLHYFRMDLYYEAGVGQLSALFKLCKLTFAIFGAYLLGLIFFGEWRVIRGFIKRN